MNEKKPCRYYNNLFITLLSLSTVEWDHHHRVELQLQRLSSIYLYIFNTASCQWVYGFFDVLLVSVLVFVLSSFFLSLRFVFLNSWMVWYQLKVEEKKTKGKKRGISASWYVRYLHIVHLVSSKHEDPGGHRALWGGIFFFELLSECQLSVSFFHYKKGIARNLLSITGTQIYTYHVPAVWLGKASKTERME